VLIPEKLFFGEHNKGLVEAGEGIDLAVDMAEIEIGYSDNFAYFNSNKAWFADHLYRVKSKEFVEYALTSPDYRSRVASWRRLYFNNYLGHLKDYKEAAMLLIEDLYERTANMP